MGWRGKAVKKIERNWCNNGKCSECLEGCSLDEMIPCSPDCENLTGDGKILLKQCLECGCDAALSVFGYNDRSALKELISDEPLINYPIDFMSIVDDLNIKEQLKKEERDKKYCPKIDSDLLIIDSYFDCDVGLKFAVKHRFNVKFTDTGSNRLAEIMLRFAEKGYQIEVIGETSYALDGLYCYEKPIVLFKKAWIQ